MNTILEKIHNGMKVYDQEHNEVGTVDYVQYGHEDPQKTDEETVSTQSVQGISETVLVDNIAKLTEPDGFPEVFRVQMLSSGFVRVDAPGLFKADRYILSDQIESVSEDNVMLNIPKSELIKRS